MQLEFAAQIKKYSQERPFRNLPEWLTNRGLIPTNEPFNLVAGMQEDKDEKEKPKAAQSFDVIAPTTDNGNRKRYLVYPKTALDDATRQVFSDHKIPTFSASDLSVEPGYTAVEVPLSARPIVSHQLSSFEDALGRLSDKKIILDLAFIIQEIQHTTRSLPKNLTLNKLALIEDANRSVILIPPITLDKGTKLPDLINGIALDAKRIVKLDRYLEFLQLLRSKFYLEGM